MLLNVICFIFLKIYKWNIFFKWGLLECNDLILCMINNLCMSWYGNKNEKR